MAAVEEEAFLSSGRLARLRRYAEEETANEASFSRSLEDAKEGVPSEDVAGGMSRALHAIGSGDMQNCKGYCARVYDLVVRRHRAQFSALKGLLGEISGRPVQDFEYNIGMSLEDNLKNPATRTGLLDLVRGISEADDKVKQDAEASAKIQRSRENGTPEVKAAISNWDRFSTMYKTAKTLVEVAAVTGFLVKLLGGIEVANSFCQQAPRGGANVRLACTSTDLNKMQDECSCTVSNGHDGPCSSSGGPERCTALKTCGGYKSTQTCQAGWTYNYQRCDAICAMLQATQAVTNAASAADSFFDRVIAFLSTHLTWLVWGAVAVAVLTFLLPWLRWLTPPKREKD